MSTQTDLERDFRELAIQPGDRVIMHSSLRAIGRVEGGPESVVAAALAVLGPTGTLVVPAFTYAAYGSSSVDLGTAAGRTGAVAESLRRTAGSLRSDHPTHSVVAWGADSRRLTEGHLDGRAMSATSPLGRLARWDGKVMLIGVAHTSNSMVHVGEEVAGVRKPPPSRGLPTVQTRTVDGRLAECALDTSPSCSAAFGSVEAVLREGAAISDGLVGDALAQVMSGSSILGAVAAMLARSPLALLCNRASCGPCSRTRAAHTPAMGVLRVPGQQGATC